MQLIVHGGAGAPPDDPDPRQAVLDEAARRGAGEATPLDAVETALRALESDPRFNAGVGGAIQSDGVVRTDAGVMCGDRSAGAAAGMDGVKHAVTVARCVRSETPHVLLAGEPAVAFADDAGVDTGCDLRTPVTSAQFEDADPPTGSPREHLAWLRSRFGRDGAGADPTADDSVDSRDHDTVGAVAREGESFAAATSTAGRWFALAGRVGDVPQIGSGFYCGPAGGASATGAGEDIARVTLSRRAVGHLEAGRDAGTAAELAVAEFAELTGADAGVVVCGRESVGSAHNAEAMQTSRVRR